MNIIENLMKTLGILLFPLLISNCMGQDKANNDNRLQAFNRQEHRLEFRGKNLFYNDTRVRLDQPLAYYEEIFGTGYEAVDYERIIEYNNLPISMNKGRDSIIDNIRIYFYYIDQNMLAEKKRNKKGNEHEYYRAVLDERYILIDGIAVNKDTEITAMNRMLAATGARTLRQKFEGTSSVERQYYTNTGEYAENIYMYRGNVSSLAFIGYTDDSTSSE